MLGGTREFAATLPVAQLYFPSWERYETAMRSIIEREYYTNHGPLVRDLESRLEGFFGVQHVVTVTNATIGLYLVAQAMDLKGKVLMPGFTFIATAQAAILAGLDPVFCDVDRSSHQISPATAERALESGVVAAVGVNLWGGSCDVPAMESWASANGLPLFFDSAHGFGSERTEGKLGGFGSAEVFSFHATKIMSSAEGGCVCTNDAELAERIRNMRSNYGIRRPTPVPLTVNARLSEGQAAVALLNLADFEENRSHNEAIFDAYRASFAGVSGVALVEPDAVTRSNRSYVVVEVDEAAFGLSRDALWSVLRAEGARARRYFLPGVHRSTPFDDLYPQYVTSLPVTDDLCARVLQLPTGALVTAEDAARVGLLIQAAQSHAEGLACVG